MPKSDYGWRRYWCPRQARIPLTAEGFLDLLPPSLRSFGDSQLSHLRDLSSIPCLVLLGELGLGKSTSLCTAYGEAKAEAAEGEYFPPFLDLRRYGEFDLGLELDRILEGCRHGTARVPLFIDSLDEARLRVATVVDMIARRLEQSVSLLSRVQIRIACRTGEWRQEYEDRLKELWKDSGASTLMVYVLAPLQESDVRLAAAAESLDPEAFLREVRRQEVGPLAAAPITLGLLFSVYRTHGHLAGSRSELYHKGCLELSREIDRTHRERDYLDARQRLAIAGRIAACTVFTNLPEIAVDTPADAATAALPLEELAGGIEYVENDRLPIGERLVLETLETALFTGTDPKSWSHRSYAEFLAASYAHEHLSGRQIKNLLFHPDGRLVPQLRGTTAWLVSMDPKLLEAVVQSDPEVALRSDAVTAHEALKESLATSLLQAATRVEQSESRLDNLYSRLAFPGLGALLRPYLVGKGKPIAARVLAIRIADACELRELLPELLTISLESAELGVLRRDAADAVIRIGDDAAKAALKPLVFLPEDTDDPYMMQLKYYGIEATWPAHLSASELFGALNPPQGEETFIHGIDLASLIVPRLTTPDYPFALSWLAHKPRAHEQRYTYLMLADAIVLGAWAHINSDAVAEALADMVISRFMIYDTIVSTDRLGQQPAADQFMSMVKSDTGRRHKLIQLLVPKLSAFRQPAYYLVHSRTPLVFSEDLGWLINQFGQTEDPRSRAVGPMRFSNCATGGTWSIPSCSTLHVRPTWRWTKPWVFHFEWLGSILLKPNADDRC